MLLFTAQTSTLTKFKTLLELFAKKEKSYIFVRQKFKPMTMDTYVSSQKLDLIHWITELDDVSVLAQVNAIKENAGLHAEMLSIERGLDDLQQGKIVSHTQAKKRYEKWL